MQSGDPANVYKPSQRLEASMAGNANVHQATRTERAALLGYRDRIGQLDAYFASRSVFATSVDG
jgi:hypothetical protein